jgi:hypothetical protein
MSRLVKKTFLTYTLAFAVMGCESMYVSELKTSGTWTGRATLLTVWPHGADTETEQVAALHVERGPDWRAPDGSNRVSPVGSDFTLVDGSGISFPPTTWARGSRVRIRGLMQTIMAFDERGRRLYATEKRKYLLQTIRVKEVEALREAEWVTD